MEHKRSDISIIIRACQEENRAGQKKLYQLFYAYGMSVALRFSKDKKEAQGILNDAFFKVFNKLDQFDQSDDFKPWFRKIIINTAIDHQRKSKRWDRNISLPNQKEQNNNLGWEHLTYEDVLKHIQSLSPAYQLVFNLYAIEGFKHHEIAEKLNISVGTSKSNYAKARKKLQALLAAEEHGKGYSYGR